MTWTVTTLGSASGFVDAVLAPNGSIYAPSYTNSAAYLRIDPDDSVHLVGTRPPPTYKWAGAGLIGNTVVGVPNRDGETLLIDTPTEASSSIVGADGGSWSWMYAASVGGKVWSAPGNASTVWKSDGTNPPEALGWTQPPNPGLDRWSGPVDCGDGTLICFSRSATAASLIIDAAAPGPAPVIRAQATAVAMMAVAGPSHTNGRVDMVIETANPTHFSLVGRVNTSGHRYQCSIRSSGFVEVYRYTGSWSGALVSSSVAWPGTGHTLGFDVTGSTLKIFIDGTLVGSGTDTGIAGAGRWGMESGGAYTSSYVRSFTSTGDAGSFTDDFATHPPAPTLGPNWATPSGVGTPAWKLVNTAALPVPATAGPNMRAEHGVAHGGKVYGAPNAVGMPIYDVATRTLDSVDTTYLSGYASGCVTPDNRILFAPRGASSALVYDPVTTLFETISTGAGFTKAVCRGDAVYLIPYTASQVVKITEWTPPRRGFRHVGLVRGARG